MIRWRSLPATEPDDQDRSMRLVEWALAVVAAAAAAALAFIR
jgi:hypothetical protein